MRTVVFAIKFGMTTVGLLLIAIGVLCAVFQQQLRDFGARQLGAAGTRYSGANFGVGDIGLSLADRGIVLHGVTFKNPQGFSEGNAVFSGAVVLLPVWNTVFSERPVFEEVLVRDTVCQVEYKAGSGSNIGALLKQIESGGEAAPTGKRPTQEFLFKKLHCGPTRLQLNVSPLPAALTGVSVPAFEIDALGTDGPARGDEVVGLFFKALAKKVLSIDGLLPV